MKGRNQEQKRLFQKWNNIELELAVKLRDEYGSDYPIITYFFKGRSRSSITSMYKNKIDKLSKVDVEKFRKSNIIKKEDIKITNVVSQMKKFQIKKYAMIYKELSELLKKKKDEVTDAKVEESVSNVEKEVELNKEDEKDKLNEEDEKDKVKDEDEKDKVKDEDEKDKVKDEDEKDKVKDEEDTKKSKSKYDVKNKGINTSNIKLIGNKRNREHGSSFQDKINEVSREAEKGKKSF